MTERKEAFNRLVQENKGIIYKICNSFCRQQNNRDDLAQEIMYNLWKSYSDFVPDYKITTWMYRVAMNVAISFYRKEKRALQFRPYSEDLLVFETEAGANDKEDELKMLYRFIYELKEIDKSIIILYLEQKTYQEIAEIIGLSETNVGTRINRIKEQLKSKFENQK